MKLSAIICTYNREKYLYNALKSIAEGSLSAALYEILVIDNRSTDQTKAIFEQFRIDFTTINARYFFEKNQGLSFARNRGITEASGDILVYIDDDALVNRGYLQNYYNFFNANTEVFAAGGPIIPIYETAEPRWMSYYTKQLLTAYLYKGKHIKPFTKTQFPGGGNAAYRKEVFDRIGQFNTQLGRKGNLLGSAEEKDIFDRMHQLKMPIYYLPDAILYHIIPPHKLECQYFNQLTYDIGKSERQRTLSISKRKYFARIASEAIKWIATIFLFCRYIITFAPQKGWKLVLFRKNVSRGLLKNHNKNENSCCCPDKIK